MEPTTTSAVTSTTRHTIQCADATSLAKIPSPMTLGPLDHPVFLIVPVAVVFVYTAGEKSREEEVIPVVRLRSAISRLLDYYPHLTGRMHIDETTGTRSIDRLGNGAELHVAHCAARLDSLSSSPRGSGRIALADLPDGGNALLAPYDPTPAAVCAGPILTVQHTRFACGGVALGIRALHAVVDSDAFFLLARDLAEVYRTGGTLAISPTLQPYLVDQMSDDITPAEREAALRYEPTLFHLEAEDAAPEAHAEGASVPPPPPPTRVVGRAMRWSAGQLAALKKAATPEDNTNGGWVSTFDALSALIWTRVYRARVLLQEQASSLGADHLPPLSSRDFLTSVNYRDRLHFPPRYPFNGIFTPYTSLPHSTLLAGDDTETAFPSLRSAAAAIHALTRNVPPEAAAATARWLAAVPDKRAVRWGFDAGYGSTMISAWNKFEMYGPVTAFDEEPVLVAAPFTPISSIDGLGYYLPTETGEGIDLYLALDERVWAMLEADRVWAAFKA